MKKYMVYGLFVILSANYWKDWLDVKPQTQSEVSEMFTTYAGFKSALDGCYIKLKQRSLYGEALTMANTESMAQLWFTGRYSNRYNDQAFQKYDYEDIYATDAINVVYSGLYNVIFQANTIINSLENHTCIDHDVAESIITV